MRWLVFEIFWLDGFVVCICVIYVNFNRIIRISWKFFFSFGVEIGNFLIIIYYCSWFNL